ncbi:MAG TPA: ABC transporter substrate-binding protein, partial [Flavobacteriales bacterium]|nr:ABC transporter substrate-binding protein [Flavobacteriales bacterium]
AGQELNEFLKGHLTAVFELPVERVGVLADSAGKAGAAPFVLRSTSALETQYYAFGLTRPPFDDIRVRRAFALAVDRKALVDGVLRGMAVPAEHGLVAPGLSNYPYELVRPLPYAPDSARALLAQAGFPDGKGFPPVTIQVNNDGFGYVQVAEAVQEQWQRELHVPVSVGVLPYAQYYERMEMGQLTLWRGGWVADHPDAANFLALLYGKNAVQDTTLPSSLNTTRYRNATFDSLFADARGTMDAQHRANALAMAERTALNDLPVLPLYHDRAMLLMRPWVRGLSINPIEYLDLTGVWFDEAPRPAH